MLVQTGKEAPRRRTLLRWYATSEASTSQGLSLRSAVRLSTLLVLWRQVKQETEEAFEAFGEACRRFQADCSFDAVSRQREGLEAETAVLTLSCQDVQSEIDALATARAEVAALSERRREEIERRKMAIAGVAS